MKGLLAICFVLVSSMVQAGEIGDLYDSSDASPTSVFGDRYAPVWVPDPGISEIGIERTYCFGTCPVYTFIVKRDGTFRYVGRSGVNREGTFTGTVPVEDLEWLALFIKESGFMQLRNSYSMNVSDSPTTYTMVVMKGQRKIVSNYADAGPSSLWAIEQLIDRLRDNANWN